MSVQKLKKAPLKEVIFELFWEGDVEQNNIAEDKGFENAVGILSERLLELSLPVQKRLVPESSPVRIFGSPIYQYWTKELKWPVVQHGPGILTVNDTEHNYLWEGTFKPLVLKTMDGLIKSYKKKLSFKKIKLQYIDAFDVPDGEIENFVNKNLRTHLKFDYELPGAKSNFNILQTFILADKSIMQLQITSGINNENKSPAVIWTTSVERSGTLNQSDIISWLDMAHDYSSKIFKTMLNPDFYECLDQ